MSQKQSIIYSFLFVVFILSLTTYYACKKNPCEAVNCLNGGACNDGTCVCPDGYKGAHCEMKIDPCENITCLNGGTCVDGTCECTEGYFGTTCEKTYASTIIGTYTCTEVCQPPTGGSSFNSTITILPSDDTKVVISNFGDSGENFTGIVTNGKIVIDTKTTNGLLLSGSGSFEGGNISISYTATGGFTCTMTMSRT